LRVVLYLAAGNISNLAVSMVSSIILARFVDLQMLGSFKLVMLYGVTLSALLSFQIHTSLLYFVAVERHRIKDWVGHSIGLFVCLGFITSCLSLLLTPLFVRIAGNGDQMHVLFVAYAPATGMRVLAGLFPILCVVCDRTSLIIKNSLILGLGSVIGNCVAVLLWPTALGFLLCDTVALLVSLLIGGWKELISGLGLDIRDFVPKMNLLTVQLKYSLKLGIANGIKLLGDRADRLIATLLLSTTGYGVYTIVAFENPLAGVVLIAFMNALIPTLSLAYKKENMKVFWYEWKRSVFLGSLAMLPLTWFSLVYAEEIIGLLFGQKFLLGANVFRLYSLVVLFRCGTYQSLLRSINVTKYHPYLALASLVVSVVVGWMGYHWCGMVGVAAGYVVSNAFYNIAVIVILSIKYDFSVKDTSGVVQVLKGTILSGLPLLPAIIISKSILSSDCSRICVMLVAATVYIILYICLILRMRIISWDAARKLCYSLKLR